MRSKPAARPSDADARLDERRLDRLFFACHSHARDIDGLHPGDSLDELCKIIAIKIADEAAAPAAQVFPSVGRLATGAFARRVRALHAGLGDVAGGRCAAAPWREPLALSPAAIARIARELAPYTLSTLRGDVKGRAFQTVLDAVVRNGMGQFFTPGAVIDFIVAACAPRAGERIIDPFCGSAHFLRRAGAASTARSRRPSLLVGVDKSERMVRIAATEMLVDDTAGMRILCADSLTGFWVDQPVPGLGAYDLVMTNPPFGSLLRPEAIARLDRFELAGRRGTPLEVLGLERSVGLLRPGGRIAIVLPDGVLSGRTMQPVRDWLQRAVTLRAVVSLPIATFQPFGASVKTSIVFASKRPARTGDATWFATVDDIGHDAAGRARPGSDLPEALTGLHRFIAERGLVMRSTIVAHAAVAQAQALTAEYFCGASPGRALFPGRCVQLGELVAVRRDSVDPRTLGPRAIDYIGLEAIEPDTGRLLGTTRIAATAVRSRSRVFRAGDVLYGRLRPALNKVLAVPEALAHGICSNEFIVLTPTAGLITPHLLARLLRLPAVRDALAGRTTGSALPRLQADSLLALEIPVIPARLQRRLEQALIAEESRWDDLRSLLGQYNGHLDAMLTRAIDDGRIVRSGSISAAMARLAKPRA